MRRRGDWRRWRLRGNAEALAKLIDYGGPSRDPARAAIALALGAVALRNTPFFLKVLQAQADPKPGILLLGESFDMLEEDLEEERFYVAVRRELLGRARERAGAENSPRRSSRRSTSDGLQAGRGRYRSRKRGRATDSRARTRAPSPQASCPRLARSAGSFDSIRRTLPIPSSLRAPTVSGPSCASPF